MDPITCCVLGICCPPESPEQLAAFEKLLMTHGMSEERAKKIAKETQKQLVTFTKKLAKLVKETP